MVRPHPTFPSTDFLSMVGDLIFDYFIGSIEQNLPQPFLRVHMGLTGRSGGPRECPLVRELRHSIRLG